MDKQTPLAAVPGRDYSLVAEVQRRQPPPQPVWATRPWMASGGRRLLAFRIRDDRVEVLVAGSPPAWVPAESVLSEHAARLWLRSSSFR